MWIFGYGSLVWKVDFPFSRKVIGYVKGYERKFWQASIDHRGVPEKPGRVVTLVPSTDPEVRVWGAAYKIHRDDVERVLEYLDHREIMGYEKVPIQFHPIKNHPQNILDPSAGRSRGVDYDNLANSVRQSFESVQKDSSSKNCDNKNKSSSSSASSAYHSGAEENDFSSGASNSPDTTTAAAATAVDDTGIIPFPDLTSPNTTTDNINDDDDGYDSQQQDSPFTVTMYYGSSANEHYIGPDSLPRMAKQIFESVGPSGKNKDYLFNLAKAMRQIADEALDEHLAELDTAVRELDTQFNLQSPGTPMEL